MEIVNGHYSLTLSDEDGRILSFRNAAGKEFVCRADACPLFRLYLYDASGAKYFVESVRAEYRFRLEAGSAVLEFDKVGGKNIFFRVRLAFDASPFIRWRFFLSNRTGDAVYKADFPAMVIENGLQGEDGGKLFWPITEGVEISDLRIRENCGLRYNGSDFPAYGWEGRYPGACQMQFMAYYRGGEGVYLAAHDADCNVKKIDFCRQGGGIRLEFGYYLGTDDTSGFESGYDMVLGVFRGDWYDAAEIYRKWLYTTDIVRIKKLKEADDLPAWWYDSPIVAVYPVRGEGADSKEITTAEYYPYTKALYAVRRLHEKFDSPVMPLLCHWEGTAPWAPPYVWPPYGDKGDFDRYVAALHENGDYIGLYCSGIAWTQCSGIEKTYDRSAEFEREGLAKIMQVDTDGVLRPALICGMPIRRGYDMCPACEETKRIAADELEKIVENSDVDYVQFFDQNLGGSTYPCYSGEHGHPRCPGKWQNEAMRGIFARMQEVLKRHGKEKKVLIGCEADAAECFVNDLRFNDSRHNIGYFVGTPVSAYNFLFHEYVNNFMGNQNTSWVIVDFEKYPDNLYYRLAHSFSQGDMLTVVLKEGGKIHWDWCTPWTVKEPDQEGVGRFIGHLSDWRRHYGREALTYGKMCKPEKVFCGRYRESIYYGGEHDFPSVVTHKYECGDGRKIQFLTNFLGKDQKIGVDAAVKSCCLIEDSRGERRGRLVAQKGVFWLTVPARSCVALEYGAGTRSGGQ